MLLFFFENIKGVHILIIPFIDASHNIIIIVYRKSKCQVQIQMSVIK